MPALLGKFAELCVHPVSDSPLGEQGVNRGDWQQGSSCQGLALIIFALGSSSWIPFWYLKSEELGL